MQTKIHEPTQIVEVMLTHAEQADEFTELLTRAPHSGQPRSAPVGLCGYG